MAYFKEFVARINKADKKGFQELWQEYSAGDEIDADEYLKILTALRNSSLAKDFDIETALQLLEKAASHFEPLFAALIDLQTTNSPPLADKLCAYLEEHYGSTSHFQDKMRLVGLKTCTQFQGALTNFLLLNHLEKGKFVFHNGGWGVGEVMNVSMVREQVELEFEKVSGKRELSFANAFKTLSPLPDDHFLARRFGDPDSLEKEAKEDPVKVVKLLLRDLGPKSAAEIKDELEGYVIPEEDWNKWWQSAKTRMKKDQAIEMPENSKEPFKLTETLRTAEEKLEKALEKTVKAGEFIDVLYSGLRDHPQIINNKEYSQNLLQKITEISGKLNEAEKLSLFFLQEDLGHPEAKEQAHKLLSSCTALNSLIVSLDILAFKKRALVELKAARPSDWQGIYLELLTASVPATIREYILKENIAGLHEKIREYLANPLEQPEFLVWYLPKALADKNLPFADKTGQTALLESYLLLLSQAEQKTGYRELVKKMQALLFAERFAIVRAILEGANKEFVKEFLLLVSKCHSISDFDSQTLYSLAYVVYPDLNKKMRAAPEEEAQTIWTTAEGMQKLQEKIKHIGTVETVENAREIEAARALGDLRENSEFKFALEKRARLQGELKTLSDQLQKVRVITKEDIPTGEVGIGSIVEVENTEGMKTTYTLLGPYEADTEKGILAFQSKLAQNMMGLKVGDSFSFQSEKYRIVAIKSYL